MEFTPSLTAFQGVLIAADSTHSFSTLTSKGGKQIISCLINRYLKNKGNFWFYM